MLIQKVFLSFKNAGRGIYQAVKSERNMRIHLVATILVLFLATILKITLTDFIILLMLIALVISGELTNTAIEKVCNILRDKYQLPYEGSRDTRDIAAGAVWAQAIIAAVIGLLIFSKYLIQM